MTKNRNIEEPLNPIGKVQEKLHQMEREGMAAFKTYIWLKENIEELVRWQKDIDRVTEMRHISEMSRDTPKEATERVNSYSRPNIVHSINKASETREKHFEDYALEMLNKNTKIIEDNGFISMNFERHGNTGYIRGDTQIWWDEWGYAYIKHKGKKLADLCHMSHPIREVLMDRLKIIENIREQT